MAHRPTQHLGPFRLERPLGRGREGEIWAATAPGGGPVAIKLLAAVRAEDVRLTREIRALAGLRHPHIVRLYDQGRVTASESTRSRGQLVEGQAWFAMEKADRSLADAPDPLPWATVHTVLQHTLGALAHAHARGVLHLDLKRSNLLQRGERTLLADFGVALERTELLARQSESLRGNLATMAPEQLRADWHALGPWTDLYALGRVLWRLLAGEHLLPAGLAPDQAWHFAQQPPEPPPLPPQVPEGVGELICMMLGPEPTLRFRRAADLAWALDEVQADRPLPWPPRSPVPRTWRRPVLEARSERLERELPGLGLSLHGVREVPLVGREAEREALWTALRDAVASRSPRAVCLRGPSGVGKSRLARWLGEVAEELGVATAVSARFEPAWHDLSRSVSQLLGQQVAERLPQDPTAATGALARVLLDRATEHPLVLWLDDVQWGTAGLALADRLLTLGGGPVLLVLTARDELLSERPEEARRLAALDGRGLASLTLQRLPPPAMDQLLRDGLDLAWDVVEALSPRVGGNPLHAIQLVDDWVSRDLLRPTPDGLRLREGVETPLPASLDRLWQDRITGVLGELERRPTSRTEPREGARIALERAACLGLDVDRVAWTAICPHQVPFDALETALAEHRLAVTGPGGWRFAHGLVREALLAAAGRADRLEDHHRACVAWLLRDGTPSDFLVLHRVGHHLLAAGEPDRAADALFAALEASHPKGRGPWEYPLLTDLGQALALAGADRHDRRVAWQRHWWARCIVHLVGAEEAWTACAAAREAAWASGDVRCQRAVRRYESVLKAWSGDHAEAARIERELLEEWAADEDWEQWHQGLGQLTTWLCRQGKLDAALEALRLREGRFDGVRAVHRGRHAVVAGMVHTARGEHDLARQVGEAGLPHAQGHPSTLANIYNNLGEANRHLGRHEEAARCYAEAVRNFRAGGITGDGVPSLNLGLLRCDQARWEAAATALTQAADTLRRTGRNLPLGVALLARARASLHLGATDEFDRLWPEVEAVLEILDPRNLDLAKEREALAATCAQLGDDARGRQVAGLSR